MLRSGRIAVLVNARNSPSLPLQWPVSALQHFDRSPDYQADARSYPAALVAGLSESHCTVLACHSPPPCSLRHERKKMIMSETKLLQGSEVESLRNSAQFFVFRAAFGMIARSLPTSSQDALLLMLETMAKAADIANGDETGPSINEEFSHQTNLAARKLSDRIKKALERE